MVSFRTLARGRFDPLFLLPPPEWQHHTGRADSDPTSLRSQGRQGLAHSSRPVFLECTDMMSLFRLVNHAESTFSRNWNPWSVFIQARVSQRPPLHILSLGQNIWNSTCPCWWFSVYCCSFHWKIPRAQCSSLSLRCVLHLSCSVSPVTGAFCPLRISLHQRDISPFIFMLRMPLYVQRPVYEPRPHEISE